MLATAGTNLFRNIISLANLLAFGAIGLLFVLNASSLAFTLGFGALSLVLITQTILFWYDSAGKREGRSGAEIVGGVSLILLALIALTLTVTASLATSGILNTASITLGAIAPSLTTILGIGFSTILVATALITALPFIGYLFTEKDYDQAKKSVRNFTFFGLTAVFVPVALFVAAPASALAVTMWSLAAVCLTAMMVFNGKDIISPRSSSTVVPISEDSSNAGERKKAVIIGKAPSDLFTTTSLSVSSTSAKQELFKEEKRELAKQSLNYKYTTGTLFGPPSLLSVYNEDNRATQDSIKELTILTGNENVAKNILRGLSSHTSQNDRELIRQFKVYIDLPEATQSSIYESLPSIHFNSGNRGSTASQGDSLLSSIGTGSSRDLNSIPSLSSSNNNQASSQPKPND
ncbi:MAG: hypothetical protein M1561_02690 [Gammaproteobacteria bacterium]|nr:hypothetical protein [Gammaproteobacteria bacterium]